MNDGWMNERTDGRTDRGQLYVDMVKIPSAYSYLKR